MIRPASLRKVIVSVLMLLMLLTPSLLFAPAQVYAICATVKIEIRQELTLERQAFDAHMRINNALSDISIEDVAVQVSFADEDGEPVLASSDPDNTDAQFFIRVDTMENIDNVDGSGSVAPETSADIHWLIIPAPGASNGLESGTLYYVGATLTYTVSGESETVDVAPDYIFVKPMPQLVLDYFLPTDVYGDDAHTSDIEPPVPFSLGLRVGNKGFGYARALKVESAQPEIVENDMGLLIGFQIDGSTVNGQPATDSLLVDFGDVAPNSAGTARWIMSCSLSGRFIDFKAEFTHADELGGQMTSLIAADDINTHFLVGDVMVDAEGRDSIEDFLAKDDDVYRVYESDFTQTDVTDQSTDSTIDNTGGALQIQTPPTAGFMYVRLDDPFNGTMMIESAIRSDGKRIKAANVWFSKTRAGAGPWQYHINIFDHNTPGGYTIEIQNPANVPQPPVIMYIPERSRVEGQQLSFLVEASDPNGTTPSLSAQRLPIGATFVDQGNGSGIFDWTPAVGQAGRYAIKFFASDGQLESSRQALVNIFSEQDSDGDGMLDSWELEHFGTLDRDGNGDFDGDGISDRDEYINGLDPTSADSVPSVPEIVAPQDGARVDQLSPELEIANSLDPEDDPITYTFELYADESYQNPIASEAGVTQQVDTTPWAVPLALEENTYYYWRVKAQDDTGSSNWAYGHFFIDIQNDPPSAPGISRPIDGVGVDNPTPALEITAAVDPDHDELTYRFELYGDSGLSTLLSFADGIAANGQSVAAWTVDLTLDNGTWYYWRTIATDSRGAQTIGPVAAFVVDTSNGTPEAPVIQSPTDGSETLATQVDLIVTAAVDPEGDHLTYHFEIDTTPCFSSPAKRTSGQVIAENDTAVWQLENLSDNTRYYWRAKAGDGQSESPWTIGSFFVNTINDAPPVPTLKNPGLDAWVNTRTPVLAVLPVMDSDDDAVSYRFEIATDPEFTAPVGFAEVPEPEWLGISTLDESTRYYWRAQAVDHHGIASVWSLTGSFFVKINGVNLPPQLNFLWPAQDVATNGQGIVLHWSDIDPEDNASIAFYYDTDASGADGVLIAENIEEDRDGTFDYYTWDIGALEGTYYIYAVIADHLSSATVYCPAAVTIDHTPPVVTFDPPGGTYGAPQSVALSADESAQIYYTLDGTTPDINSQLYSAPIAISEDTPLTCMAIDTAGNQSEAVSEAYSFQATDITVTVGTDKNRTLSGVRVYAFTEAGAYTGRYATTDGLGQVHFNPDDFTAGSYKFRVDYLGYRFWSDAAMLPDTRAIDVLIAEEAVVVSVATAAGPAVGVRVYLFSASGAYLGLYETTDDNGEVLFMLPVGHEFKFRADVMGSQYWSGTTTVTSGGTNSLPLETGGGKLSVTVNKSAAEPLAGLKVYLFKTTGAYLGQNATTNSDGAVDFNVPQGDYKVRVDYMGYQFWSDDTTVSTDTLAMVTIAHQQITVAVESRFNQAIAPLTGVPVYLFSPSGSFLGLSRTTDDQGRAFFDLPQKAYQVRADYLMRQFWSVEFTWQDPTVSVPLSEAQITVTGGGQPLEGLRVYAFTATSSYLGLNADTDSDGQVLFQLPEGEYLFRADYQGSQFWSAVSDLIADQTHAIGISTGGGAFVFSLTTDAGDPLSGVNCYVFDENHAYLGLRETTDTSGEVTFDLADGDYHIRVDYLGNQFWSDVITVPDTMAAQHIIAHTVVEVTFETTAGPVPDARIYLFGDSDNYLDRYLETDSDGLARFNLPAGIDIMFRADLLGSRYWSELLTVPDTGPAATTIHAGGGRLTLTVEDGSGNPMPDLKSYLFTPTGTYLNVQQTTAADGTATFDLPEADYKIRVDYLGGSYWTDIITVDQDLGVTLPIGHQLVTLTVQGRFQGVDDPLSGVRIYLFTSTGTYLDRYADSDASGQVQFNLPARDYTARADYMGDHFWSDVFNSQSSDITIPMADAQITVTGAGLPQAGIRVYLFSDTGAYLGSNAATDGDGRVLFRAPAGSYQARADYQSNQYWSGIQVLDPDALKPVVISVGGGTFALNVTREASTPLPGVKCYVFDESGAYVGLFGATNAQGQTFFDLADGQFQFRIDYLGYRYWSSVVTVPTALEAEVRIPHQDVTLTLTGSYLGSADPLGGQRLYLFTPAGSYMGLSQTTGGDGTAVFQLPDQEYQVRADYLGNHYWSDIFHSQDTPIAIAQGAVDLHAHRSGTGADAVRVYLFNTNGTYLGRYQVTDIDGWTTFILPEDTYRFRVDADGIQRWSADTAIDADQSQVVEVDLD